MTSEQTAVAKPVAPQTVWIDEVSWLDRIPQSVAMLLLLCVFLAVWQAVYTLRLISPIIMPSPIETVMDIIMVATNLLTGDYMLRALWITTEEVLIGFVIAVVLGFALGLLVGETSFGERAVMPYLVGINAAPKVAFAPLFVSWLGFGIASKISLQLARHIGRRLRRAVFKYVI